MEERCLVWRRADAAGTGAFTSGDVSQLGGVNNGCFFGCMAVPKSCLKEEKKNTRQNKESRKHCGFILDGRFSVMSILVLAQKCNISFHVII